MNASSHPDPTTRPDRLLKVADVGHVLGITPRTVKRLASDGRLPRVVIGARTTRYRLSDVVAFIEGCEEHLDDDGPAENRAVGQERDDAARPSAA